MEEEARRLALEALQKRYCMNCFCLKAECICSQTELKAFDSRADSKQAVPRVRSLRCFDVDGAGNGRVLGQIEGPGGGGLRYHG